MRLDKYFQNMDIKTGDHILINDVREYVIISHMNGRRTIVCVSDYEESYPWEYLHNIVDINNIYFNGIAKIINKSDEYNFNKTLLTGTIIRHICSGKLYTICRESFTYNWHVIALHNGKIIKSVVHADIFIDYAALKLLLDDLKQYELMDVIPFGD